jgi:hypothetical protein
MAVSWANQAVINSRFDFFKSVNLRGALQKRASFNLGITEKSDLLVLPWKKPFNTAAVFPHSSTSHLLFFDFFLLQSYILLVFQ